MNQSYIQHVSMIVALVACLVASKPGRLRVTVLSERDVDNYRSRTLPPRQRRDYSLCISGDDPRLSYC